MVKNPSLRNPPPIKFQLGKEHVKYIPQIGDLQKWICYFEDGSWE